MQKQKISSLKWKESNVRITFTKLQSVRTIHQLIEHKHRDLNTKINKNTEHKKSITVDNE